MKLRFLWAGAAAALMAFVIACGSSPTSATQSGNFQVLLKDTPFSDAKAVLVSFSDVSVHASGGGWTTLTFAGGAASRTCDLKQLQTAQDVLGTATLPAGHYTQVRLTVTSAAIYFDNAAPSPACAPTIAAPAGKSASLDVPSGQVILNREFDITNAGTVKMLLDFNGDQSIIQTGNGSYKITPVISIVSVQ